jgi:hypothetical protein
MGLVCRANPALFREPLAGSSSYKQPPRPVTYALWIGIGPNQPAIGQVGGEADAPTSVQVPFEVKANSSTVMPLSCNGSVNSCANPARAGSLFTLFINGIGTAEADQITGKITGPNPSPFSTGSWCACRTGKQAPADERNVAQASACELVFLSLLD